jgi:hypothetical protein
MAQKMGQYVLVKRQSTSAIIQGGITQKAVIFRMSRVGVLKTVYFKPTFSITWDAVYDVVL